MLYSIFGVQLFAAIIYYATPSNALVLDLTQAGLIGLVPNYLYVFVVHYVKTRPKYPELEAFREAERIAKEIGLSLSYDLKFAEVGLEEIESCYGDISTVTSCNGPPKFTLFKYGRPIKYGSADKNADGEGVLSDDEKTTKGMFEWLERQTKSSVTVLSKEEEAKKWVEGNAFSVLGYFKGYSGKSTRHNFYQASENLAGYGYNLVEVRNSTLVAASYLLDTIVVNQEFGKIQLQLDEYENQTPHRITIFVKANANSTGPIYEMNQQQLDQAIRINMLVFVMFTHERCPSSEIFQSAAVTGKESGMLDYLNMTFATVESQSHTLKKLQKYGFSSQNNFENCSHPEILMHLFKYGRMIKYDGTESEGTSSKELKGILNWLEKVTKPAAKRVWNVQDLKLIVEYNEVSVVGYFQGPKIQEARMEFYKAADQMWDYVWGDVVSNELNPYVATTIIFYRNFGASQSVLMPEKGSLTSSEIQAFVQKEASNTTFPIPTRPTPPPPKSDFEYKNEKQIAIFDGKEFQGNRIMLNLSSGDCIQIPEDWGKGTWSINTFGQCVDFFEAPGCQFDASQLQWNKFRLVSTMTTAHQDLSKVKSPSGGFQSMAFCPTDSKFFGDLPDSVVALIVTVAVAGIIALCYLARVVVIRAMSSQ